MNDTIFTPGANSPSGHVRSHDDHAARVDAPHLDAPRERVQRVAGGNVVEVVGARETERDRARRSSGTRPCASGSRVYRP